MEDGAHHLIEGNGVARGGGLGIRVQVLDRGADPTGGDIGIAHAGETRRSRRERRPRSSRGPGPRTRQMPRVYIEIRSRGGGAWVSALVLTPRGVWLEGGAGDGLIDEFVFVVLHQGLELGAGDSDKRLFGRQHLAKPEFLVSVENFHPYFLHLVIPALLVIDHALEVDGEIDELRAFCLGLGRGGGSLSAEAFHSSRACM